MCQGIIGKIDQEKQKKNQVIIKRIDLDILA